MSKEQRCRKRKRISYKMEETGVVYVAITRKVGREKWAHYEMAKTLIRPDNGKRWTINGHIMKWRKLEYVLTTGKGG